MRSKTVARVEVGADEAARAWRRSQSRQDAWSSRLLHEAGVSAFMDAFECADRPIPYDALAQSAYAALTMAMQTRAASLWGTRPYKTWIAPAPETLRWHACEGSYL